MKRNWQLDTDKLIDELGGERKRLLLQCCCGPCSSYVLEYLTKYFYVTVLFYNPNIQPEAEYEKRRFCMERVAERYPESVSVLDCGYDGNAFSSAVRGLEGEPEGGARCVKCIELRLCETAKLAKAGGFDYFCTTLSVSPHKNEQIINETGLALERQFGVKWLVSDFKKRDGYKRSIELSGEYGLYRQSYCGCLFSLNGQEKADKTLHEKSERNFE